MAEIGTMVEENHGKIDLTLLPERKADKFTLVEGRATDVGKVRVSNEDSLATLTFTCLVESVSQPGGLYLVSDGLGGHEDGQLASSMAATIMVDKISKAFSSSSEPRDFNGNCEQEIRDILEEAVFSANSAIYHTALVNQNDMGATLTAALILGNTSYIINVGDSRTYLFNRENGLKLITQDHSLVFRFYLMGQLEFEEIYRHPLRSHILRSLGEKTLQQELKDLELRAAHPYWFTQRLEKGDSLLLCTDGLWQMVRDNQIEKILHQHPDLQEACDTLVKAANDNGGEDNISVLLVKVH